MDNALKWGVLLATVEGFGDASFKKYGQTNNSLFFALGEVVYLVLGYIFQLAVKHNKLGIVNTYWDATSNIFGILIGMVMGETYTFHQIIGVIFISVGILMI